MNRCRSCGAEIKWIKMLSGKNMPVDAQKRYIKKDGGHEVLVTEGGELIRGTFASLEDGANGEGYISHFSTCPNANKHRRMANEKH